MEEVDVNPEAALSDGINASGTTSSSSQNRDIVPFDHSDRPGIGQLAYPGGVTADRVGTRFNLRHCERPL